MCIKELTYTESLMCFTGNKLVKREIYLSVFMGGGGFQITTKQSSGDLLLFLRALSHS